MNARSSPLALVAFGLLASLCAAACTSPTGDGNEGAPSPATDDGVGESESEVRASCTSPRRYFATFRDGAGTCEPIPATRGRWVPEKLFADAPADVQTSTCAYRWEGEPYSRPDRDAIYAKLGGWSNGLAPACGASSEPAIGALQPIPYDDNYILGGSVGCDVCGILRNGNVWVVLPPEKIFRKQLRVQLSSGETRAFQIQPTEARALSIQLPPPPPGTRYKQGRVKIL